MKKILTILLILLTLTSFFSCDANAVKENMFQTESEKKDIRNATIADRNIQEKKSHRNQRLL